MPTITAHIVIVDKKITVSFDTTITGPMVLTPTLARQLARRLHAVADKLEPRPSRNGGCPR